MSNDDLESLFSAPPAGFIEERKRVVAALKDAGRKDEAKTAEKIPRPSLALWTVNQIARRDPELVRRLGEITGRLQSAAGPEYGAAAVDHRDVLQQLRERAGEVLADAGHEIAPHVVQRVIANLRAAASTPETRATLELGRLVRDVEEPEAASLFGTAAGAEAAGGDGGSASETTTHDAAAPAAVAMTAADAKARERARAKELSDAEREVKRRRAAEVAARKEVVGAERAIAAARESLNVKEVRAASARAAAEAAAQALAQAEADLARLSKA